MPRSAREIDLDPRTYVGLSFPLRADNNNNFAMTKNSLQQSVHNLRNLLLTNLRERPSQPEFGSRLTELCFEPMNDDLREKIDGEVRRAVSKWLPYIIIKNINSVIEDGGSTNTVTVIITFSTTLDPTSSEELQLTPTS